VSDVQREQEAFEEPLWRALVVFRLAALAYAAFLVVRNQHNYAHPVAAWVDVGVMAAWTVASSYGYARPAWRAWPLLVADLVITAGCLLVSPWIFGAHGQRPGGPSVPVNWIAGPVLAWAIAGGRRRATVAALLMGACDIGARSTGPLNQFTISGAVLLLLAGIAVGHVSRLGAQAQEQLRQAVELEAATRERERLARDIHDSVLQVLSLVQRRGAEIGGAAAELGVLAGEQEVALRSLVSPVRSDGGNDLRDLLTPYASATVSLATPAQPVTLPPRVARELAAAVGAAVSNVHRHGGERAHAWILVEDAPDAVTVSIRDDGPGIAPGRLDEAAKAGRLGVAQSIRGRIHDLGGDVSIVSEPGRGTEIELHVPRAPRW
jgi:signal transduction histidine kinase